MTISSQTNKSGPYPGNGVATVFGGGFKIDDETHVKVISTDAAGVETVLTLATHYTVTGVGNPTFSIARTPAPAIGISTTLIRNLPFTQELDLQSQGAYNAEDVEAALDAAVARDQQLQEAVDRAVKLPASADSSQLDALVANINRLADSADEVDTVAGISANVNTVAGIAADVSAVAAVAPAVGASIANAAAVAADKATVAADKGIVAGYKADVLADKNTVAADKATVAADKGLVNTAKTAVDTAKGLVDIAKAATDTNAGLTAADRVQTGLDRIQTGADRIAAAASAADAAASAGANTSMPVQIAAATDEAFADDAMLAARKADGSLIKRSWANVKTALASVFLPLVGGTLTGALILSTAVNTQLRIASTIAAGIPFLNIVNTTRDWSIRVEGAAGSLNIRDNTGVEDKLVIAPASTVTGSILGTAANYLAGTLAKLLTIAQVWAAAVPVNLGATLTGNLTLDFATFINGYGTMTGNIVLNGVSNLKQGQSGVITFLNPSGFTVAVNTAVGKTHNAAALSVGTGEFKLSYYCDRDSKVFWSLAGKAIA